NSESKTRHRARGRDRGRVAGQHAAGEERAADDVAVVQGPGRVRGRACLARWVAAEGMAEGGWAWCRVDVRRSAPWARALVGAASSREPSAPYPGSHRRARAHGALLRGLR